MSKKSGLGDTFYVDGYDLSGDVNNIEMSMPRETFTVPGVNVSAQERIYGRTDGKMSWTAYFNPASNQSHERFSALPTTNVIVSYHNGATVGNQAAGIVAKQLNYDNSRGDDGSLTSKIDAEGNGSALVWGELLTTGEQTFASSGSGTVLDYGASVGTTNFGLIAYIQAVSIDSGTATVAIQSSSDNAGSDPYADITGAVFTAVTAKTSERIATSTTEAVERYLRLNITGTFTNLVCVVFAYRPLAAWSL